MDYRLELVAVPVSDVDRSKAFYTDQAGFNADHDHRVSDELRFVQLTPPGSACSIVIGTGITDGPPGSVGVAGGRPVPARSPSRVSRRHSANWPNSLLATSWTAPRPNEATLPVSCTSLDTCSRVRLSPSGSRLVVTLAAAVPEPLTSRPLACSTALWLASS